MHWPPPPPGRGKPPFLYYNWRLFARRRDAYPRERRMPEGVHCSWFGFCIPSCGPLGNAFFHSAGFPPHFWAWLECILLLCWFPTSLLGGPGMQMKRFVQMHSLLLLSGRMEKEDSCDFHSFYKHSCEWFNAISPISILTSPKTKNGFWGINLFPS